MDILKQLFYDKEIDVILSKCDDIKYAKKEEVRKIIKILQDNNCNNKIMRKIIMQNPSFLIRKYEKIKEIIDILKEYGIENIELCFIIYPELLNKSAYEIDNFYIKKHQEGYSNEEINDILETEPYLIDDEMTI